MPQRKTSLKTMRHSYNEGRSRPKQARNMKREFREDIPTKKERKQAFIEKVCFVILALVLGFVLYNLASCDVSSAFADDEEAFVEQDRPGFFSEGAFEASVTEVESTEGAEEAVDGPGITSRALDELINSVDLSIEVPSYRDNDTTSSSSASSSSSSRRFSSRTFHSEDAYSFNYDEENERLTAILESSSEEEEAEEDNGSLSDEMEQTATELDEVNARIAALDVAIAESRAQLDEINERLPMQEKASAEAARALYVMDQYTPSLLSVIMRSASLSEFLTNFEYLNRIRDHIVDQIEETKQLQLEAQNATAALEEAQDQVSLEKENAEIALKGTQESRMEAQRLAQEEVIRQANEVAAVADMVQQEAELKTAELAIAQSNVALAREELAAQTTEEGKRAAEEALAEAEAKEQEIKDLLSALLQRTSDTYNTTDPMMLPTGALSGLSDDGVNWDVTKDEFLSEWTRRIDNYLAGTALAGYGRNFAEAAWTYGVDPRFSPAISNTESTNGKYCFLPHNAWGWGDVSWDSWEEAIDAHVRGLSQGYGYTLTAAGARKYCPPNWENWYNNTASQMNLI